MHEHAIAERNAKATDRSQQAAVTLAERAGLPVPTLKVNVGSAGAAVARLHERERMADFLEQLVAAVPADRGDLVGAAPAGKRGKD